jgi:hypothetical protein
LLSAIKGHILDEAEYMGTYQRSTPGGSESGHGKAAIPETFKGAGAETMKIDDRAVPALLVLVRKS